MVLLTLALFVGAWQAIVAIWNIHPIVLPAPTRVLRVAIAELPILRRAFLNTASASLAGLGISIVLGSLIAIIFSQSNLCAAPSIPTWSSCRPCPLLLWPRC